MNQIEMELVDFLNMLGFPTNKPASSVSTLNFPASSVVERPDNLSSNQTIADKLLLL